MTRDREVSQIGVVAFFTVAILVATPAVAQRTFVKMRGEVIDSRADEAVSSDARRRTARSADSCDVSGIAWHGENVPGGGTLNPQAWGNPSTINTSGRIAFIAQVDGSERNQGVFSAAGDGLVPIAIGCGRGGGSGDPGSACGDPSPIGGTFSGFFTGTFFAPPINDLGDILFIADVYGGQSPRGLFLYQGDTGEIQKVAAVGDNSPLGGSFSAIGPGSLNSARQVVFLAFTGASTDGNLFLWDGGAVNKVVAAGDPAPGGGFFWAIGTERIGFVDGTMMPTGPLGDINDLGQISFRGFVTGGQALGGLFLSDGGSYQWYVSTGDATPIGGVYADFGAAILNNAGQIAFFADVNLGPSFTSGWFTGSPGSWRKAIAFSDQIGDGQVIGIAYSRNPHAPLDDFGNLALWATVRTPLGDRETLVINQPDTTVLTVVRQGVPTPFGGQIGTIQSWPSLSRDGQGTLGASTPGAGSILNAHMVYRSCAP